MIPKIIIVQDDDGLNAVYIAPDGLSVESAAARVGDAIDKAKAANPDEWTYEEVSDILVKQGYIDAKYAVVTE